MTAAEDVELRAIRIVAKYFNAIADAWNTGWAWGKDHAAWHENDASWAYNQGQSLAVQLWNRTFQETGSALEACEAVIWLATQNGIHPKKH